jgi:predicted dehydrogenase
MSENKIKLGIIGCGKQANIHIQALLETDLYEITFLCDINTKNMESLQQSLGVGDIAKSKDYKKCIDSKKVEAVLISTHTYVHVEQTLYAIKQKKHVLLEKPLSTTIKDLDKLCIAALKSDVIVYPAMEYHHSYLFDNLYQMVNSEFLAGTKYIVASEHRNSFFLPWFYDKSLSGGSINDKLIHFFDIICSLFAPSRPISIYASGSQHVHKKGSKIKGLMEEEYVLEKSNVVDNAIIAIEFEDDKRASVLLNMYEGIPVEGLQFHISGLNGTYVRVTNADTPNYEIETNQGGKLSTQTILDKGDSDRLGFGHPGSKQLFVYFYNAVRGIAPARLDIFGVRDSQVLALAAEESVKLKKPVDLVRYNNPEIETLAKQKNAGNKETIVFHPMSEITHTLRQELRPRFNFIRQFLFGRALSKDYLRITKRILRQIINRLKPQFDFSLLQGKNMFLAVVLPWETINIVIKDNDVFVSDKIPVDKSFMQLTITVTENGYAGLMNGDSLNKLYMTRQIKVVGDLIQARQFRAPVLKIIEEVKKVCAPLTLANKR